MAGSETTATALACITYYLQRNPDILRALQQEIRTSFESYEQINDASTTPLEYLKAVILEGMRMYPPLPFPLPRVVPPEGGIVDGHFVPGGVSILASPSSVHFPSHPRVSGRMIILTYGVQTIVSTNPFAASMSTENFHDPWVFDPKRWMTAESDDVLDASQPFSLGSRVCLGQRYEQLRFHVLGALADKKTLPQSGLDGNAHNSCQDSLQVRLGVG